MFEKLLADLIKGGAFLGTLYLIFGSRTEVKKWVVKLWSNCFYNFISSYI